MALLDQYMTKVDANYNKMRNDLTTKQGVALGANQSLNSSMSNNKSGMSINTPPMSVEKPNTLPTYKPQMSMEKPSVLSAYQKPTTPPAQVSGIQSPTVPQTYANPFGGTVNDAATAKMLQEDYDATIRMGQQNKAKQDSNGTSVGQTPTLPPSTIPTPNTETPTPTAETYDWMTEAQKKLDAQNGTTTPTTTPTDYMAEWGISKDKIDADLEAKKQAIKQKYDVMRQEAEQYTESERMSTLAAQYSPGETNPLASGGASINSESQRRLNQRKDAISAMEAEDIAAAEAAAEGRKFEGAGMARQKQLDQEAALQQEFNNKRATLSDTIEFAKTNRQFSQEDKTNAYTNFANLIELGGSQAFDGYTDEDYAGLDKALGYKTGTSSNIATRIKALELKGESQIMTLDDGSVINLKTAKDGTISYDTIIKAPAETVKTDYQKVSAGEALYDPTTGQWITSPAGTMTEKEKLAQQEVQKATTESVTQAMKKVSLIDEILNDENLDAVVGIKGPSNYLPGSDAQLVKNKINQLIGDLILDERGRLKGSGAISDFETKIIRQAATPLGTNLSNEQTRAVLSDIKQKFSNVLTANYLSQATGLSQEEAAMQLENMKQQLGDYPTLEEIQTDFPSFNSEAQTSLKGNNVYETFAQTYPPQSKGGQCGDFAHELVNFPSIGDGLNAKKKSVDKFGIKKENWQPRVGDVVITDENPTYGHVAVIVAIQNGKAILAESNYNQDEKVSYGRTLDLSSPKIYGAIRGSLKLNNLS